ncbi:hypothetical protein BDZ91DRAFT_549757 [Kalaharituber pfeilii]|nr:hypothetical protein BDZ91DRAFT_549757 [Kalaharituber pfeilii]
MIYGSLPKSFLLGTVPLPDLGYSGSCTAPQCFAAGFFPTKDPGEVWLVLHRLWREIHRSSSEPPNAPLPASPQIGKIAISKFRTVLLYHKLPGYVWNTLWSFSVGTNAGGRESGIIDKWGDADGQPDMLLCDQMFWTMKFAKRRVRQQKKHLMWRVHRFGLHPIMAAANPNSVVAIPAGIEVLPAQGTGI